MNRSLRWSMPFTLLLTLAPVPSAVAQEVAGECPLCQVGARWADRFQLRESDPVRNRPDWAPPTQIVTLYGATFAEQLRAIVPGAEVVGVSDTTEVAAVIAGAQVYLGMCTPGIIEAGQDLRYIHILRAGADSCAQVPEVAERGILVTNLQRILGPQIADHAMALLLSLSRNMAAFAVLQDQGDFQRAPSDLTGLDLLELEGKTMLVVGLGGIGTEVARRAHAFGMRVTATRNSSREGPDFVDYVGLSDELLALAAEADVVVNAAPLTPETEGLFDAEFYDHMKETAIFVNVGRGQSAVTDDLVAALESGAIWGAGLDVVDPEPLPAGHRLWTLPRVVMSPHIAGGSDQIQSKFAGLSAENVRRYVAGDGVFNVVNLGRGY